MSRKKVRGEFIEKGGKQPGNPPPPPKMEDKRPSMPKPTSLNPRRAQRALALAEARERVRRFLVAVEELGGDNEHLHLIHIGDDEKYELRASDLRLLIEE